MKIKYPILLFLAACLGSVYYKFGHGTGDSATGQRSIYDSITGIGSLSRTIQTARSQSTASTTSDNTGRNASPIGGIGSPYGTGKNGAQSYRGETPGSIVRDDLSLLQAAAKGDTAGVESRLADHAWIDSRDANRRTALIYASWNGHTAIIERLLAAGANISLEDRNGNNAIDYAAGRGQADIVQFLLTHAHITDDRHYMEYAAIIQAAYAGDPARLPTGKLASINRINPEGQSPLHIAAGNGSVALIDELIKRSAQVNNANSEGRTPLHWAAWNNQPQAIEFLVAHGSDVSARDITGDTPLILAVQNNSKNALQMLIIKGADKYIVDKLGKTAGIIAEDKGYKDLVGLLQ